MREQYLKWNFYRQSLPVRHKYFLLLPNFPPINYALLILYLSKTTTSLPLPCLFSSLACWVHEHIHTCINTPYMRAIKKWKFYVYNLNIMNFEEGFLKDNSQNMLNVNGKNGNALYNSYIMSWNTFEFSHDVSIWR